MRQLTVFEDAEVAQRFADALYVSGIASTINSTRDSAFSLWVHDESEMAQAAALLEQYEQDPNAHQFVEAEREARRLRHGEKEERKRSRFRTVRAREALSERSGFGPLTIVVGAACVGSAVLVGLSGDERTFPLLFVPSLIAEGQIWRLVSPIFVHHGLLHLLFNLYWFVQLGSLIEARRSSAILAGLIVISAILSNFAQFIMTGPAFGGISGVVYALFGYLWLRGRTDPRHAVLDPGIIRFMLFWLVLSIVLSSAGLMPIANGAHVGGLAVGAAWGWLSAKLARR